jgi:hypothetical protein
MQGLSRPLAKPACCTLLLALSCLAEAPPVELTIRDLTPKFLAFYDSATKEHADEAKRWELWRESYGFAAVPPGPEGETMARKMLDTAWPRYASALSVIRKGAAGIQPPPQKTLQSVANLLDASVPVKATLVVFVGDFSNNAFTAPGANGPTVAIPVEGLGAALSMTHEFTHVVEAEQAHLSLDWTRSIAHTIFAEGLAMRATEKLHPGLAAKDYVGELSPDWFARARAKRAAILADIAPHLADSDSAAVMKYTMGTGGAGIDREAYYAGWIVIEDLLKHGWSFARLARVSDAEMVKLVGDSLGRLKAEPY